jgi:HK97 family phage portal protein
MRNIFKRREKALTGSSNVVSALQGGWAPFPMLGSGSRERILMAFNSAQSASLAWTYTNSPAVRTVIDVLVRNIGQLDLRLYEEIDEAERQSRPDHPAALSLRYPNEDTPSDQFIRALFTDYLIYDNAYALLAPAASRKLTFEHIPASMVEVQGRSLFHAENYRVWRPDNGVPVDFSPEQILHWHGENPHDPRVGFSRLQTLRAVIAEDAALQAATVELANSGLSQPVYGYRPLEAPDIEPGPRRALEEDLANRMRGANRTPFILEEGTELRPYGVSPRDAQMFEVRRWAVSQIATAYGVPLGMVGLDTQNLKEAQSQFYADCLPPYCEAFTRMLNQRILVRAYNWTAGCFEFSLDEKLMGDERIKTLVSATGRPVMLTDEARAKLNLPPVDGGDELVTPLNVIVGDNPKPSPQVMPPQDPNKPPQDGSYREEPPKALVKAEERLPQLHPGRKAELDRQHRNIDRMQGVVQKHFNRLERSLGEKSRKGIQTKAADWVRWDKEFGSDLHDALERIVEAEGGIYALKLGGHDFDMRKVVHYLQAMAEGAASAINVTIRQEIDELGLEDAMARGPQHVASAGVSLGAKGTQWARMEAARQGPDAQNRVKTWIPNTRRHAEFGGDTVPLGAEWPAGFAPGSAPGCACSMAVS